MSHQPSIEVMLTLLTSAAAAAADALTSCLHGGGKDTDVNQLLAKCPDQLRLRGWGSECTERVCVCGDHVS